MRVEFRLGVNARTGLQCAKNIKLVSVRIMPPPIHSKRWFQRHNRTFHISKDAVLSFGRGIQNHSGRWSASPHWAQSIKRMVEVQKGIRGSSGETRRTFSAQRFCGFQKL
jgi:hypothetical protein